jgi:ankyrin repeat protein
MNATRVEKPLPYATLLVLSALASGCVTPMDKAATRGDVAQVRALLASGVAANERNVDGATPLMFAACHCRPDVVKVLLDAGANPNDKDLTYGWTPLEYVRACRLAEGCDEVRRLLLAAGAQDVPTPSAEGGTMMAAVAPAPAPAQPAAGGLFGMAMAVHQPAMGVPSPQPAAQAAPAADSGADETPAPRAPAPAPRSDVDEPNYSTAENPDNFALVIGIAKYRDIPEAQYADNDARAVKAHLLALGYPEENIITLLGDHATKSTLEDKLERWLPMNVSAKSTVFVYYSGHGAPDPESSDAYLVPWDGDPSSLKATAFPLARFYKDLNALPAKRVLVALDACFSGGGGRSVLAKGARPLVAKVVTGFPETGKVVGLTASGADQISGTLDAKGHGAFTYYLLRGLNGAALADEHVTIGSLYDYLSPKVSAAAHREEREQNPQILPAQDAARSIQLR